jgi:hypothetical protein
MKAIIISCIFLVITLPSLAQVPTTGLVAEYLFANGSYDDTNPNNYGPNNATASSFVSSTTDRFGNENHAKDLLGIHAFEEEATYINLGSSTTLKPTKGTISIWVNVDAISTGGWGYTYNPIILATNPNSPKNYMEAYALYIHMDEKTPMARAVNPPETVTEVTGAKIKFKEWHHYAITYDSKSLKLYIDGVLVSEKNKDYTTLFSGDKIYIGSSMNESKNRALDGQVDDVRIYNRVLSETDILQLKNEANPVSVPIYAELKNILDANYYPITGASNTVYFYYKEDYRAGNLTFNVYEEGQTIVSNATLENVDLSNTPTKRYGTNRYKLELPSLNAGKFYLLEVINEKGEKQFLRFKRIII